MISPFSISTPNHLPSASCVCFRRSAERISFGSNPALSHNWRGTISSALAKALTISCPFPSMLRACSRRCFATSSSTAPPPATTLRDFSDRFTTMSASWMLRSLSAMNCSLPPLSTMVDVRSLGHPVKRLNRSSPTCFSSNFTHVPSTPSKMPLVLVWMVAPVALATRFRSPSSTRPAQKRPRSAKYCVARSPMGSLLSTIFAPQSTQESSLS
mmetsp:Transcript_37815/g.81604  ORF Transcript_37815/g.81604 Transcript_37815/m.81604 type:complete len:213 (+) Transcript_37815:528-1166(+)